MKNMTIGKKLCLSFGAMVVLALALGGFAVYEFEKVSENLLAVIGDYSEVRSESQLLITDLLTARRHEKDFLARKDQKYIKKMDATVASMRQRTAIIAELAPKIGLDDLGDELRTINQGIGKYQGAFYQVAQLIKARGNKTSGIQGRTRSASHQMEDLLKQTGSDALMVQYLTMRRHEKDFNLRGDKKYLGKMLKTVDAFTAMLPDKVGDHNLRQELNGAVNNYLTAFKQLVDNVSMVKAQYPVMRQAAHDVEAPVLKLGKRVQTLIADKSQAARQTKDTSSLVILLSLATTVLLGAALAFFSIRSITGPVKRIIDSLNQGSSQVRSAAGQVSTSSQSLAEGSSEQAASLEETTSSLEEMSSMTRQNADNAQQADSLMGEAKAIVDQANAAMAELKQAMEKINQASGETAKIIKTIDEIAFQTNLLALNAAVEAARAGEAGAGFAVVADEVRNLAMRAAEAAKNTQGLIEGNLHNIKDGAELVAATDQAFMEVAESAGKVAQLVGEIAAASGEQSQGIDQLNQSMTQIDKVTQSNASNAEESAAASEQLSAQSQAMSGVVGELMALVDGGKGTPQTMPQAQPVGQVLALEAPHNLRTPSKAPAKVLRPEEALPLDGQDFKDF